MTCAPCSENPRFEIRPEPLTFLTEGFRIFRQSFQAHAEIRHQFSLQPLPSESFPVYYSLMILNSMLNNFYY